MVNGSCSSSSSSPSGVQHRLHEKFFRQFYGASYYNIFEAGGRRASMAEHKGAGPFTVLIVEVCLVEC